MFMMSPWKLERWTRIERGKDAMMLSELLLRDARADASTAKGADEVQSVHPFVVVPMGGTSMRRIRRSRRATNVRMRKARAAAVRLFWSQSRVLQSWAKLGGFSTRIAAAYGEH